MAILRRSVLEASLVSVIVIGHPEVACGIARKSSMVGDSLWWEAGHEKSPARTYLTGVFSLRIPRDNPGIMKTYRNA
jgi:hypothetical protein